MKKVFSQIWNNKYSDTEWNLAKYSLMFFWLFKVIPILVKYNAAPFPQGIFNWYTFDFIGNPSYRYAIIIVCLVLAAMYLSEKKMQLACIGLFIISLFIFSLEESNGILNRYSLLSFIFGAQAFSYFISTHFTKLDYTQLRFNFSIQAIAAAYMLSAMSKLLTSGLNWITDSKYFVLQILKSHYYKYITTIDPQHLEAGNTYIRFIENYPNSIAILLTTSLILELFAWVSCLNKKYALVYGCLLFLMHVGIKYIMDISLVGISRPMIIFMINPLFITWIVAFMPLVKLIKKK